MPKRCACLMFLALPIFLCGCSAQKSSVPSKPSITIWHWMTDRGGAFAELAKKYEAQTGVKVNFELYAPSEAYSQKVRAAAQGVSLPDIFGILGEKYDFASFIKAGHIMELTPYMDAQAGKWKEGFFLKALAMNEFPTGNTYGIPPGIYGVPLDMMTIKMVYNKDLLQQITGYSQPPSTFEEFIALGPKIKAANLEGLVSGWGELWMINCFANNLALNLMGKDKLLATIRGEIPYTDPDWVKVFFLFGQMQDSGVLASGLVNMVNKTAEQIFANGRAVFAFNGSWCVNVYKGMNPGLNYGVMLPVKVSDKYPPSFWGGAGSSLMVNARSENKEEAVKFLQWLTAQEQQQYLAGATLSLAANKDCLVEGPNALTQFAQGLELSTHPYTWGISEDPQVIEAMAKGIQSIIIQEKTPDEVASLVQEVKERQAAKARTMIPYAR